MAYQARGRGPLFDSSTHALITQRGKELLGLLLIAVGLFLAAVLISYTPQDPNWLSASDAPVQNWGGRFGALVSAMLHMAVGWGSWALVLALVVWGGRFALHLGQERALARAIPIPVFVLLAAMYCATHETPAFWEHSFGMGGMLGGVVAGALFTFLPVGTSFGFKIVSLLLAMGTLSLGAFVLGFTREELTRIGRFLMVSVIMAYAALRSMVVQALGHGANGARRGGKAVQRYRAQRREAAIRAANEEAPDHEEVAGAGADVSGNTSAPTRRSLFRRGDSGAGIAPEPQLFETPVGDGESLVDDGEAALEKEARLEAKIAQAIRSKTHRDMALSAHSQDEATAATLPKEPPLSGPAPSPATPLPQIMASRGGIEPSAPPVGIVPLRAPTPPAMPTPEAAPQPNSRETVEPEAAERDAHEMHPASLPTEPAAPSNFAPARTAAPSGPQVQPTLHQPAAPVPVERSARAASDAASLSALPQTDPASVFDLPPLDLLTHPNAVERHILSDEALEENARILEAVLQDYGVKGEIVSVRPGPVVTMYELEPAPGLKASRVIGLADDIARSMSALSARVSTVPGRSVIGIELPNEKREKVVLRQILADQTFAQGRHALPLALGKDIGGDPVVANLAKMPHLLIAGTTGSGKSVAINTMILSLLYKLTPDDCRLIMIDPKMLELSVYDGIPHLLSPVVTDPKKAVVALKWVVGEMEERYRKMSKMGVRNIDGYNGRVADTLAKGEMFTRTVQTGFDDETGEPVFETEEIQPEKMPYIVVIVDEMADLMMVAGKEIEACIQRLAQMARASGIHLIMATQRPSVDVITGTIKANFPTRISFQVTSKVDSRTILGEMGAEQLLGMGDMLYMAGGAKITRCHGPFVSDEEVEEIVNHLKAYGPPDYVGGVIEGPDSETESNLDLVMGLGGNTNGEDALYDQAVAVVIKDRKCSTSYIQRKLGIGYNKAARLVEQMEDEGVVSSANHVGKREILVPEQN